MPNFVTIVGFQGPTGVVSQSLQTESRQYQGVPSSFTIRTSAADLQVTAGQKLFIQNLSTTALGVKYGAGATTSSISVVLRAGTANDDGQGGSIEIDDFVGLVSVVAMSGSLRYVAWTIG
jgi:hypothetical protein